MSDEETTTRLLSATCVERRAARPAGLVSRSYAEHSRGRPWETCFSQAASLRGIAQKTSFARGRYVSGPRCRGGRFDFLALRPLHRHESNRTPPAMFAAARSLSRESERARRPGDPNGLRLVLSGAAPLVGRSLCGVARSDLARGRALATAQEHALTAAYRAGLSACGDRQDDAGG